MVAFLFAIGLILFYYVGGLVQEFIRENSGEREFHKYRKPNQPYQELRNNDP